MTNTMESLSPSSPQGSSPVDFEDLQNFLNSFEAQKEDPFRFQKPPADSPSPPDAADEEHQADATASPSTNSSQSQTPPFQILSLPPSHPQAFQLVPPGPEPSDSNVSLESTVSISQQTDCSACTIPSTTHHPETLLCEFRGLMGCSVTFPIYNPQGWKIHIGAFHLQHKYPRHSICWFCDVEFKAESNDMLVCKQKFEERLDHIHSHFVHGTERALRPDFFMVDHLETHKFIDGATARRAKEYTELPREFQLSKKFDWDRTLFGSNNLPLRRELPDLATVAGARRPRRDGTLRPERNQAYHL